MPTLTRWFIKSALVYFVAALLIGVVLTARPILALPPALAALAPAYLHLLMVGWITQLIFGVVFWMFPRYSSEKPRGNESLALATYWLLNLGLILRAAGEPMHALAPDIGWGWLLAASAVMQWLAGLGFVVNTWGRVKEK